MKPPPPMIARFRIGHGQREGDGDGCIDGIAAFLEDLLGGVGGEFVGDGYRRRGQYRRLRMGFSRRRAWFQRTRPIWKTPLQRPFQA